MLSGDCHLSEQQGHHIGGLPVGSVKEVWQSYSGEGCQRIWAVEGKVYPLGAPPSACNYTRGKHKHKDSWNLNNTKIQTEEWGGVSPQYEFH